MIVYHFLYRFVYGFVGIQCVYFSDDDVVLVLLLTGTVLFFIIDYLPYSDISSREE
ncbi:hypothetical protein QBC47DRAFT_380190 [Echria macrotheca]|uniref:Uncharacterized protein n=1 Tax=Echria macrotheca TaxID=438768 RepID=A0AAJ0BIQ1_9PEZI|nr:hypothetical protein QBC47DRAFT_380190 [Echria macrotheca]